MYARTLPFSAVLFVSPAIIWTTSTLTVEDVTSAQRISPLREIDSKPFHSHTRVSEIKSVTALTRFAFRQYQCDSFARRSDFGPRKVQALALTPQELCSYFFASAGRLGFADAHR